MERLSNYARHGYLDTNEEWKSRVRNARSRLHALEVLYGGFYEVRASMFGGQRTVVRVNIDNLTDDGVVQWWNDIAANGSNYATESDVAEGDRNAGISLTVTQQKAITGIDSITWDHLTDRDIQALIRDLSGNEVPKPGGGHYQHYKEVTEALHGLKVKVASLERSLGNPKLS